MQKLGIIKTNVDAIKLLNIALEHEWAVSFEYTIHAYSMPKATYFYQDPVMQVRKDARAQTIQIGIDEMYHALQLGIVIQQMGGIPSFKTDEVIRYPRIIDNLKRDKKTEDLVTDLYRTAELVEGAFPKIQNMIDTLEAEGHQDALCYQPAPENRDKEEIQILHEIMRLENELMHRYLKYTLLFSDHQDLSQRLFKNAIDQMRHWDKNAGTLIKLGDVVRIENAEKDAEGVERSVSPMPDLYPGEDRVTSLETLLPTEEELVRLYERLIPFFQDGEVKERLTPNLALDREHVFTQTYLLENARQIAGLK